MADDHANILPAEVYRALPPRLARELSTICRITKDHPAAVLADAVELHLDELAGEIFDPALAYPADEAAGAVS